ncbi:phosphotransferase [Shewanella sp. A32]|uniref:phosphotransferase n=1 Tax=Shewanella sp. A32 TaxID=3031327 RepID=UPI0023B9EDC5|nr:phosphotransferase [Shewanella sp. A32]MDF0533527.1 phosphotransferase [Shewanella sp. A32]
MKLHEISGKLFEPISAALRTLSLPEPQLIESQPLGLSNRSFRLVFEHKSLLLRLNSPVTDQICDRNNEIDCWQLAECAGLAPKLYWVDPEKHFYLSDWLSESATGLGRDYVPWRQLAAQVPHKLPGSALNLDPDVPTPDPTSLYPAKQLLRLMQGLQQLPKPMLDISLRQQWEIYLSRLQQMAATGNYAGAGTWAAQQWLQRLQWLQQLSLSRRFDLLDACLVSHQFCHRDLSAHNLLLHNNQLFCIDFEYCCSSHPLFELAGVIACHQLAPDARQWLMGEYLSDHPCLTIGSQQALPAAMDIFWLYSCAWALQMADGQCRDGREYFGWFDNYRQLIGE